MISRQQWHDISAGFARATLEELRQFAAKLTPQAGPAPIPADFNAEDLYHLFLTEMKAALVSVVTVERATHEEIDHTQQPRKREDIVESGTSEHTDEDEGTATASSPSR
jgi:hypothetical protein